MKHLTAAALTAALLIAPSRSSSHRPHAPVSQRGQPWSLRVGRPAPRQRSGALVHRAPRRVADLRGPQARAPVGGDVSMSKGSEVAALTIPAFLWSGLYASWRRRLGLRVRRHGSMAASSSSRAAPSTTGPAGSPISPTNSPTTTTARSSDTSCRPRPMRMAPTRPQRPRPRPRHRRGAAGGGGAALRWSSVEDAHSLDGDDWSGGEYERPCTLTAIAAIWQAHEDYPAAVGS